MAASASGSAPVAGSLVYFGTFPDPSSVVPFGIGIPPDSHNVYATNPSTYGLRVWLKDNSGNLTYDLGYGILGTKIIVANNSFIYIFDYANTLIHQYERETSGLDWGRIISQNSYSDGNFYEQSNGPIAVVSKNMNNLYYGGFSSTNAIITNWKIDSGWGTLTSYSTINTINSNQVSIAGSFDSKNIYLLTSENSPYWKKLEIYDRENTNGVLTYNDSIDYTTALPSQILINPNDLWVYILLGDIGSGSDIKIYSRNTTTGILTYDSSFSSGLDLRYAVISNDGTNIYIEGVAVVSSVAVHRIYEFSLINNSITYLGFVTIPNNDYSASNEPIIISSDDVFVYYGGTTNIYGYQRISPPPIGSGQAIFGYGTSSGFPINITNLVSSIGVVSNDVAGVGTSRLALAAASFGTDKAIFGYGNDGNCSSLTNLVSNTGVVSGDVTGVGTARYGLAASSYGTDKAIFGYGFSGSVSSITNLVSNSGVVANDVTGVGTARYILAAASYGTDKAIFGYGYAGGYLSLTNLVSNTGTVATDTTGVGTDRRYLAAAGYGTDKAIFGYGTDGSNHLSMTNLVNNSGVVASDVTGVGTAREGLAAAVYGTDKAIFGYGFDNGYISLTNLVSNTGVVSTDTAGVGTARYGLAAASFGG